MTVTSTRFSSADLESFPNDGKRYEIIDGELYVTKQPTWTHQGVCDNMVVILDGWSRSSGRGTVRAAPGVIFADDDDVAPDIVWVSKERLQTILREDGHLHGPPELVAEVLSPGTRNERRDREAKLKLYSRRGVDEYWIVNALDRSIEVFRRQGEALVGVQRLTAQETLTSTLLPGLEVGVDRVFAGV